MDKIDFVVPWVDCNDPEWIASYNRYRPEKPLSDKGRFRNWGLFRYWFRAVERYAPWVNKVYLITNGKFPEWINEECDRLVLVKHTDYIPSKYLPTFNSITIELNLGRLKGLSEHFVYFNDDIFINAPVSPEHYFREGLPCDYNFETIYRNPQYTKENKFGVDIDVFCDVAVLNRYFNRKETVRQAWKKWYGPHLWGKPLLFSLLLLGRSKFENFVLFHFEQPMLKSVFQEIWEKEEYFLNESCSKFRNATTVNQYLIRYWQFATNRFFPVRRQGLLCFQYSDAILRDIEKAVLEERYPTICINDTPNCSEDEYLAAANSVRSTFEKKFPTPSIFEKPQ